MSVLVVIVSFNNVHYTIKATESAARQTVPTDVVVWDNNSPDPRVMDGLARSRFPSNVHLEFHKNNILWTPAVNAAIDQFGAGHDFICFMNNDIALPRDAIERLLETANEPDVGLVGPMGWALGGPQDYATHKEAWLAAGKGADEAFRAQGPIRVPYLVGACVLLPKTTWDTVGRLDEDMPLGADDHDYSLRVKQAGLKLLVDPRVCVEHAGHASGSAPEWGEWGSRSWDAFNSKWAGYFVDTEEAINCHWSGIYRPNWDLGTGWLSPPERALINAKRTV